MSNKSSVENSYNSAIQTYQDFLPALQTKYNSLLDQLNTEQGTQSNILTGQFGTQKTSLTNEIAKRGLTASAGSNFYDTQQSALAGNQNTTMQSLLDTYASKKLGVTGQQTSDTQNILAAIAGLNTQKSSALEQIDEFNKQQKLREAAQKLAEKTAKEASKNSADDLAYKYASLKASSASTAPDYNEQILGDIKSALSGAGNYAPYLREVIASNYKGKLPQSTIDSYINKYMADGWEDAAKRAAK